MQDFRFITRPNALHVLNAPSPGATASLAIGAEIVADGGGGGGMTRRGRELIRAFKADERPLRFRLGERWLPVEEVVDRWYDPDAIYFRVRADDGATYILRHVDGSEALDPEAYRADPNAIICSNA